MVRTGKAKRLARREKRSEKRQDRQDGRQERREGRRNAGAPVVAASKAAVVRVTKQAAMKAATCACDAGTISPDGAISSGKTKVLGYQGLITCDGGGEAGIIISPWVKASIQKSAYPWTTVWASGIDVPGLTEFLTFALEARVVKMVVLLESRVGSTTDPCMLVYGLIPATVLTTDVGSYALAAALNDRNGGMLMTRSWGEGDKQEIIWTADTKVDRSMKLATAYSSSGFGDVYNGVGDGNMTGPTSRILIAAKGIASLKLAVANITYYVEYTVTSGNADYLNPKPVYQNPQVAALERGMHAKLRNHFDGSQLQAVAAARAKLPALLARTIQNIGLDDIESVVETVSKVADVAILFASVL